MKVRAIYKGEWIEGYYYLRYADGKPYVITKNGVAHPVPQDSVCKCIGMWDIQGRKVYENDIVVTDEFIKKQRYVVKWSQSDMRFCLLPYGSKTFFKGQYLPLSGSVRLEVVGNTILQEIRGKANENDWRLKEMIEDERKKHAKRGDGKYKDRLADEAAELIVSP